ncbi:MAG: hypothetical protein A2942_02390 [Candidatus Lloydbacteria bacterium RIFCSPLOWO2_01_FULL_50_20]|uniref:Transcriptional repressor PaaX-like central Cas2-like domain-containing protein n=1 Tax=Candidatus Lloydbacteria bacterium RIFCSPLOWO2_01_FULL_50_20 TaxID=1798665 RepID=A0A1G2DKH7_9BACT|nr:MAG: hypothetical protein A2942_02390 [Candidatus Lloydbacteria bacterium RIFCSPLOWO2_01_FULL_50_20]
MKKPRSSAPRFQNGSRYYHILDEISAGDRFIGFLFSARSTRMMHNIISVRARERYMNRLAVERLEACGYVRRARKNGATMFFATKEGRLALRRSYEYSSRAIIHREKWDGGWRMIAYDFPEKERSARNSLRYVLSKSHFLQIQKSVWIFPYDCSLLSTLIEKDETIHAHTIFIKAVGISSEAAHKKHFGIA